jgi:prevent-host-death family protein
MLVFNTIFLIVYKHITATEANQNLSRVLREVAAGTTFSVTSRGKPIAEISPPKKSLAKNQDLRKLWEAMDKLPVLITGTYSRDDL